MWGGEGWGSECGEVRGGESECGEVSVLFWLTIIKSTIIFGQLKYF